MNQLGVAHYSVDYGWECWMPTELAVPIVDGAPLHEMFEDSFWGIDIELVAPPSRHWLGDPVYVEYSRTVILDGGCGVAGCCGVIAQVDVTPDSVVWSDFYCHGNLDIPASVRFTFERVAYEAAVAGVRDGPITMIGPDDEGSIRARG